MAQCITCDLTFDISAAEYAFLTRVSPRINGETFVIPPPRKCPQCRAQERMAWRNERHLFPRNCDFSGKRLISCFPPDVNYPVVDNKEWWSDSNDPIVKTPLDPKTPIFEEFAKLQRLAPRRHTFNYSEERQINSIYTSCAGDLKDCYLLFSAARDERCLYGAYVNDCFDCIDCFFVFNSTNCYECIDCKGCNFLRYSRSCTDCFDSFFLCDCRGCNDCIGCVGLRQKRFHIFNRPYSKDDYYKELERLGLVLPLRRSKAVTLQAALERLIRETPQRFQHGEQNEGSTGDYLWNTKDCICCFDTVNSRDCRYCSWFMDGSDSMDVYAWGEMELCYQISGGGDKMYGCAFTAMSFGCRNSFYLDNCVYCKDCFACVGLKNKQYCILNRQCTEAEYESLVPQLIAQMIAREEWGEFLPTSLSPWGYNHTVAADYFPLTSAKSVALGFNWSDYQQPPVEASSVIDGSALPDSIDEIQDDLLAIAVTCSQSNRRFKITKPELDFYRVNGIPLPQFHPEVRHLNRAGKRNPRQLWSRTCQQCNAKIETTFDPARPEIVWCDNCYLKGIYS